MKKIAMQFVKNLIINLLFVTCIVIILSIVFYDKISLSKVIPEPEEYTLSEEMEKEIKDGNIEELQEVIVNYKINGKDLKKYEKTKEYDKGKANPFSSETILEFNNTVTLDNNITINNNESFGFYEDDGTK